MPQHDKTNLPDSAFVDGDWEVQYIEGHLYMTSEHEPDQQVHLQPKAAWNLLEYLFNNRGDLYNRAFRVPKDDFTKEDLKLLGWLEKAAWKHGYFVNCRFGKLELVMSLPFESEVIPFALNRQGLMEALGWMEARGWMEEQ